MQDNEIHDLFMSVAKGPVENDKATIKVFTVLVKATLRYRDDLLASKSITVTVDDVRTALKWLVPVLDTGELPRTDHWVSLDLLKIWIEELKGHGTPLHS